MTSSPSAIPLPSPLRWFVALSLLLTAASLLHIAWVLHVVHTPHHGLPFDLYSRALFEDLDNFTIKLHLVHRPEFFTVEWKYLYPAPGVFVYEFFGLFDRLSSPRHPHLGSHLVYFGLIATSLLTLGLNWSAAMHRRGLRRRSAHLFFLATLACSWPLAYALHQGNVEAVLWIGVALGLWLCYRGRWLAAALLLATVGSVKIYPLLFFGLFLAARRYRELFCGCLLAIALTLGSLAFIGPTIPIAWQHVSAGVAAFSAMGLSLQGVQPISSMFDHSLSGLLHLLLRSHPRLLATVLHRYLIVAALITSALFFTRVWRLPFANQVLFITLAAIVLPTTSFDYTLELLYVPLASLTCIAVSFAARDQTLPGLLPALACLALLCAPELFLSYHGLYIYGQFKAGVILALLALSLRYPFPDPDTPSPNRTSLPHPV